MKGKIIQEIKAVREKSSVAVEKNTRIKLDSLGIARRETYDTIINRLIQFFEEHEECRRTKAKK